MKKIKYNLKATMADAEKDEAAGKQVRKLISQDSIAELLKQTKKPVNAANQNGK